jgi:endonuclease/exonuclease/phosphatase family metal-dependent hydrolase
MICYSSDYSFVTPPYDDNYIIEDSTVGRRIRPIVHGILEDQNGQSVAYIAAVHLKATPDGAEVRLQQIKVLATYLAKLDRRLPVVILGDFNTFGDDTEVYADEFSKESLGIRNVYNPNAVTFITPRSKGKFDHIWINRGLSEASPIATSEVCRTSMRAVPTPSPVAEYNREISDHCFVRAKFAVNPVQ